MPLRRLLLSVSQGQNCRFCKRGAELRRRALALAFCDEVGRDHGSRCDQQVDGRKNFANIPA